MNASIHDEQLPLKILHKTGSVVLIFSSCRRHDMSCYSTAPRSWGKVLKGTSGWHTIASTIPRKREAQV